MNKSRTHGKLLSTIRNSFSHASQVTSHALADEVLYNPYIRQLLLFRKKSDKIKSGKVKIDTSDLIGSYIVDTRDFISDGSEMDMTISMPFDKFFYFKNKLRYFDTKTNKWKFKKKSEIEGYEEKPLVVLYSVTRNSLFSARKAKMTWAISSVTSLANLSLFQYAIETPKTDLNKSLHSFDGFDFSLFLERLLYPMRMAIGRSMSSPIDLRSIQDVAVSAFEIFLDAFEEGQHITTTDANEKTLTSWFDMFLRKMDIQEQLKKNLLAILVSALKKTQIKAHVASMFMLYYYTDIENRHDFVKTFIDILDLKKGSADDKIKDEIRQHFLEVGDTTRNHLTEIYRNMHLPLFYKQDEELANTNPETARVGAAQLWALMHSQLPIAIVPKAIQNLDEEISKNLETLPFSPILLINEYPELAGAITIISLAYPKVPEPDKYELNLMFEDFMDGNDVRSRIKKIYQKHANTDKPDNSSIFKALKEVNVGDLSLGQWLFGMEKPWKSIYNFEEMDAYERLSDLAPEMNKARKTITDVAFSLMASGKPTEKNMLDFIDNHPKFTSAVSILYLMATDVVPTNHKNDIRLIIDSVFSSQNYNPEKSTSNFVKAITSHSALMTIRTIMSEENKNYDYSNAYWLTGEAKPYAPTELLPPEERFLDLNLQLKAVPRGSIDSFLDMALSRAKEIKVQIAIKISTFIEKYPEMRGILASIIMASSNFDERSRKRLYTFLSESLNLNPQTLIEYLIDENFIPSAVKATSHLHDAKAAKSNFTLTDAQVRIYGGNNISMKAIESIIDGLEILQKKNPQQITALKIRLKELRAKGDSNKTVINHPTIIDKMYMLMLLADNSGQLYHESMKIVQNRYSGGHPQTQLELARDLLNFLVKHRSEILGIDVANNSSGNEGGSVPPSGSGGKNSGNGGDLVGMKPTTTNDMIKTFKSWTSDKNPFVVHSEDFHAMHRISGDLSPMNAGKIAQQGGTSLVGLGYPSLYKTGLLQSGAVFMPYRMQSSPPIIQPPVIGF